MNKFHIISIFCLLCGCGVHAKSEVSIDSCRTLALMNNKQLMIKRQNVEAAKFQTKEAFSAYLPAFDFVGGYMYNQNKISIFDSDQLLPTKTFNPATQSYEFNIAKNPLTGEPIKTADGQYVPETVALIPKDAMTYDIHNVFFGAITLTQPLYMGGKIKALNNIANYAVGLSETMLDEEAQNVVYAVDAAYWQVVSLNAKYRLAQSYVALVDSLDHNVGALVEQGMATRADKLSVDVKLNSAQVDLAKVKNGLALSRMALAQLCGLPIDEELTLADEDISEIAFSCPPQAQYNMEDVYADRQDIRALRIGALISDEKVKVARSAMLPSLALTGAYSFSNPNMTDGFKKRFAGGFSVGAVLSIPIWHWGGNYYKYRQAQADLKSLQLKIEDAQQLVSLQVKQAAFRANESLNTYQLSKTNIKSAEENLRCAQLSFKEGMSTSDDVLAAQTAWLKANSECIDALIDVFMCDTYLKKVTGKMDVGNFSLSSDF